MLTLLYTANTQPNTINKLRVSICTVLRLLVSRTFSPIISTTRRAHHKLHRLLYVRHTLHYTRHHVLQLFFDNDVVAPRRYYYCCGLVGDRTPMFGAGDLCVLRGSVRGRNGLLQRRGVRRCSACAHDDKVCVCVLSSSSSGFVREIGVIVLVRRYLSDMSYEYVIIPARVFRTLTCTDM